MKNLLPAFILLLSVSSCIKIKEEDVDCANKPQTPILSSTQYVKNLGDQLIVSVSQPQSNASYTWTLPDGTETSGQTLNLMLGSTALSGEYSVAASTSQALCQSDATTFNVTVNAVMPSCGSTNTFKLGGSNTLSTSIGSGSDYTDYYRTYWTFGFTTLYIYFGKMPTTAGTQVYKVYNSSYPEYLDDDECSISYSGGSYYNGTSGNLFVKYENNAFHVVFCDANMRSSSGNNYPNSQGNLYFSD